MGRLNGSVEDICRELATGKNGLTGAEAARRLAAYGANVLGEHETAGALIALLRLFANPLVAVLLVSAVLSYFLGEVSGALIIAVMVVLSVALQFYHEYRSGAAAAALRRRVAVHATVIRDGGEREVPLAEVAPGDVFVVAAGDVVPGDARLLEAKDLYVNQASLTGESFPAAKRASAVAQEAVALTDMDYALFMGSNVTSGMGRAVVVATGRETEIGHIAHTLAMAGPETEFQRGIREFSFMLMRVIVVLVLAIFFINAFLKHDLFESFLFAVAISVGITPELLPMIMTINMANGAVAMSHRGVIVKQLAAIQNFGSMDVLCSDKTGTLTEGEMKLVGWQGADGGQDGPVLLHAYLNSTLQGGLKNPLDMTVAARTPPAEAGEFAKADEIPFDFVRRMLSVVVERAGERTLITKGAPESVLPRCAFYWEDSQVKPLTDETRGAIEARIAAESEMGRRVLALAYKPVAADGGFTAEDEEKLIFSGTLAFFDPPRETVRETLAELKALGVKVKVLTGDNDLVARKVCADVGIPVERIMSGAEVDRLTDEALSRLIDDTAVFARLNPVQKNRIIALLKRKGHVVGYIGDGINDAPSLRTADVGISVNNAVDVAKEAAAIILLEKSLAALKDGVVEGRRTFANTLKYIMMGTSSNFGNMFSMSVASVMVPFLPMRPVQILLNNFLYDVSQVTIPGDAVDEEFISRPRRWDLKFLRRFMLVFGPVSSLFDVLTFSVLIYGFQAGEALFQTGWFVESLATQVLVIHVIRSRYSVLRSHASFWLTVSTLACVAVGVAIPYTPVGEFFGFVPLPAVYLATVAALVAAYLVLVEGVKRWFFARHGW